VKAQVMTRDDSSGGWVPLGGGGVSVVGVRRTAAPPPPPSQHPPPQPAYSIYACRLADNSVTAMFHCTDRTESAHLSETRADLSK